MLLMSVWYATLLMSVWYATLLMSVWYVALLISFVNWHMLFSMTTLVCNATYVCLVCNSTYVCLVCNSTYVCLICSSTYIVCKLAHALSHDYFGMQCYLCLFRMQLELCLLWVGACTFLWLLCYVSLSFGYVTQLMVVWYNWPWHLPQSTGTHVWHSGFRSAGPFSNPTVVTVNARLSRFHSLNDATHTFPLLGIYITKEHTKTKYKSVTITDNFTYTRALTKK